MKVDRTLSACIPHEERLCTIVAGVIEIAYKLGFSVVIEGVENEQQADWIGQFPTVLAQGHLFSRPQRSKGRSR
ncbi:EAL domain-containing protein [Burkholderia ubonensis]|uniref:EAL domain-containing protein n=1 Tax=Burkholderia ubonensis TaxID=101571 RepID=UPI0012F8F65F